MTTTGIDFRATSTFVTDPANCTYCLGDAYPTTRGGLTFGWLAGAGSTTRDRSTSVDVRLAGINGTSGSGTFRVDLPATGTYNIGIAMGDAGSNQSGQSFTVLDNTTSLLTGGPQSPNSNQYMDASGVVRTSDTDWINNNVQKSLTFATTTFKITAAGTVFGVLAHLDIVASGGGVTFAPSTLAMMGCG